MRYGNMRCFEKALEKERQNGQINLAHVTAKEKEIKQKELELAVLKLELYALTNREENEDLSALEIRNIFIHAFFEKAKYMKNPDVFITNMATYVKLDLTHLFGIPIFVNPDAEDKLGWVKVGKIKL